MSDAYNGFLKRQDNNVGFGVETPWSKKPAQKTTTTKTTESKGVLKNTMNKAKEALNKAQTKALAEKKKRETGTPVPYRVDNEVKIPSIIEMDKKKRKEMSEFFENNMKKIRPKEEKAPLLPSQMKQNTEKKKTTPNNNKTKPRPQPAPQPIKIEPVKLDTIKIEPIVKIEQPKIELPKEPIISEEEMKKMMKRSLHAEAYNRIDAKAAKRKEKAERKLEKRLEKAKDAKDVAKAQEKYAKAVAKAERKQETAYEKIDYKDNMKILNKIEKEEQGELNALLTPDGRVPEGATKEQKMEIGKQHYDVVMAGAAKDAARKQHKENKKRIKGDYDIAKKTAALEAAYTANGKTAPAKETIKEAQTVDREKANKEYADKLANKDNWKTVEVQKGIPLPEMKDVVQTADDKIIDGGMLPEVVVTGKKPKSDDKIIDGGVLPEVVVTGKANKGLQSSIGEFAADKQANYPSSAKQAAEVQKQAAEAKKQVEAATAIWAKMYGGRGG